MTSISVEIKGLEEMLKQIDSIEKLEGLQAAVLAGGEQVKRKVVVYPLFTIANSPENPTGKWYERSYGPKWRRKDGSIGGRKTSEDLKHSWNVQSRDGGMSVLIGTDTTYAPYVMDKEKQARFHAARGWRTIQEIGREEVTTIMKFISDYIQKRFGIK